MELNKEELQAGILRGINLNYCYFLSFAFPKRGLGRIDATTAIIRRIAENDLTSAHEAETGSPSIVYSLALGENAYTRLRAAKDKNEPSPFDGKHQKFFAENFLYSNNIPRKDDLKVGNEYSVLLQIWCDRVNKEFVHKRIESLVLELMDENGPKIPAHLISRGIGGRRLRKDFRGKYRPVGPLGFVEGLGNPHDDAGVYDASLIDTSIGMGSFMAFISCRVNTAAFEETAHSFAGKIFEHPTAGASAKIEYSKGAIMGMFSRGEENFRAKSQSIGGKVTGQNQIFCPFGAHKKLMQHAREKEGLPKIVRRGITYENGEGLFFISFQKDISTQLIPLLRQMQHQDLVMYQKANRSSDGDKLLRKSSRVNEAKGQGRPVHLTEGDLKFVGVISEGYYFMPTIAYLKSFGQ